jgi:hypothetical protein
VKGDIMPNYLMRYKGQYRLKANIDESTNDYPRDINGKLETDDVYIKCANGGQIYHFGHSVLVAYIPSLGRGHNILRAMAFDLCGIEEKIPHKDIAAALLNKGIIKSIHENDEEIEFKFSSKDIATIAKYMKPLTGGADISPFSARNLPKSDYVIPLEDLELYKKITDPVPKEDLLTISYATKHFISNIVSKNPLYKSKDIKAEMKKSMLRGKEFIHYSGMWNEFINFLKEELSTYEKNGEI